MPQVVARPDDRVKVKKDKWAEDYTRYVSSRADEFVTEDWLIRYTNYRYLNNQLNQKEFKQYCDPLGWQGGDGLDYVQPLNKMHTIVELLLGDELNRPFTYNIVDLAPGTTNERLRKEHYEYTRAIKARLNISFEAHKAFIEELVKKEVQGQPAPTPEEQQQIIEQKKAELEDHYKHILDFEVIEEKYKNFLTSQEITMYKLAKQLYYQEEVPHQKNMGFKHLLASALEAVRVEEVNGMPKLEVLNPLGVIYHKSAEQRWIQKGDYAAYRQEMTISDVKKRYGDYLSKKDLKKVVDMARKVDGMNDSWFSKDGKSSSHWHRLEQNYFASQSNQSAFHEGAYGASNIDYDTMLTVTDCYWVSERYVAIYTYFDEYGDEQAEFRDGLFKVPDFAEKLKEIDERGIKKDFYQWEDETGIHRLYYTWIPEVWRGTDIENKVFVRCEPMGSEFQPTVENMYEVNLPIYGFVDNAVNAKFISVVDRMMPWYKLYLVLMSKMLSRISKDYGGFTAINSLFLDDKVGIDKLMSYAVKGGILPYNPLQNTQMSGVVTNQKAADRVEFNSMQDIKYYAELAQFIEREIYKAAGVPPERQGQTSTNSNATDNQRDVHQSQIITERLFIAHEELWEKVMQQAVVMVARVAHKDHVFVRDILGDDEIEIIESHKIDPNSQFRFKLTNSSAQSRMKILSEQHLHALIQNDKAKLSTLLKMMRKGDVDGELIREIELIEKEIDSKEQQANQMKQQMQQQQLEAVQEQEHIKHEREKELKLIETDSRERIATMQLQAKLLQGMDGSGSSDQDGINDMVETSLKQRDADRKDRELDLKRAELSLKKKQASNKSS